MPSSSYKYSCCRSCKDTNYGAIETGSLSIQDEERFFDKHNTIHELNIDNLHDSHLFQIHRDEEIRLSSNISSNVLQNTLSYEKRPKQQLSANEAIARVTVPLPALQLPNQKSWLCMFIVCVLLCSFSEPVVARVVTTSTCRARVEGRIINLEPLQRLDGKPRFNIAAGSVNFTFNPCASFNMPLDPHSGAGDQCYFVSVCKTEQPTDDSRPRYYTVGIQSSVNFYSDQLGSPKIPVAVKNVLAVSLDPEGDSSEEDQENIRHSSGDDVEDEDDDEDGNYGPGVEENDSEEENDNFLNSNHNPVNNNGALTQNEKLNGSRLITENNEHEELGYDDLELYDSSFSSSEEMRVIYLSYKGVRSMKKSKTYIYLICDHTKRSAEEAVFKYIPVSRSNDYHFELHHQCSCPDGCPDFGNYDYSDFMSDVQVLNGTEKLNAEAQRTKVEPKFMWLILVINGGIVAFAIIIGAVFCRHGGGNGAYYNMLPAIHSSRLTIGSTESLFISRSKLHRPDYLEYTSALTKAAEPPVIDGGIIEHKYLDIGQRLGGGLFGDTYIAEFSERKVAAKRINVGVHQNQLTEDDLDWIVKEVNKLSKQRHKNLVSVMGMCCDSPQPYVIQEYINGDTLKEILRRQDKQVLPWTKKLKMCIQIADAMAYLHSANHPILHRDLRCANIMVDENERVKVCDYGFTRIMQKLRQKCSGRRGCYCRKEMSAVPSSVRWTAPEVLLFPKADESHNADILTRHCDVYSFAMVMWEIATSSDPFEDIPDEDEVIEIVKGGGRPPLDSLIDIHPLYDDLTKKCWSQIPDNRPTFKHVAGQLKRILQSVTKSGAIGKRQHTTSTTSYMQSLLNTHLTE